MSGSNFAEGGGGGDGKHPQCCTGSKKPTAFRVNIDVQTETGNVTVKKLIFWTSLGLYMTGADKK